MVIGRKRIEESYLCQLLTWILFQMNLGLYPPDYDSDGRYVEAARGLDDSRLLDAAETLVTLQTSDLGSGSNNPLFGSGLGHSIHEERQPLGQFQSGLGQGGRGAPEVGEGGGRGRGKRGPSKRGRKKVGEGRGSGGVEISQPEEGIVETENISEMLQVTQPVEPMMQVGPLALRGSILDEILSEKKAQLMEDPDIIEFMRQHGIKH